LRAIALPVKSLSETKSRLAPMLSPLERGALTLAMLEDVMDVTQEIAGLGHVGGVPRRSGARDRALGRSAHAIREEKPPLANAIRQVEDEALGRDADALAVLLPDTPFVTTEALTRCASHARAGRARAVLPTRAGPTCSSAASDAIHARFGPDSYRKHLEAAAVADLPTSIVGAPELAFDLDLPGDILTVLDARRQGRTREVCLDMDLASRVATRA
jgi:2-phospho-L-lactate guanylyltransferase